MTAIQKFTHVDAANTGKDRVSQSHQASFSRYNAQTDNPVGAADVGSEAAMGSEATAQVANVRRSVAR